MKKTILHFCFTILLILCSSGGFAQVIVDGDVAEWGDPKKMNYDQENKLYYSFKKDKQFLYMAIYKNQNEQKCKSGGVQLFFSDKKADTTGLGITFANVFKDSITKKFLRRSHDTFTVQNLDINKKQVLPTYNETGILVEWKATQIEFVPNDVNHQTKDIPADPNILSAEIQIPLIYLQKYNSDILYFCISLRGLLYNLKRGNSQIITSFSNPKNINEIERLDYITPTQYYATLNLSKL